MVKETELCVTRREEIISACAELYKTKNFKDVTIKEIGKITPFTRTSIYNYFHTKEEIFLALLQKEYEIWIEELNKIIDDNKSLSKEKFADKLAKTLENREQLLKIMSMNHFEMELTSREENLIEFKKVYGESLRTVKKCLDKFFVDMTERDKENFLYIFFPFVYGIYPYTAVSEKQNKAMAAAGTNFKIHSIYEIAYNCIMKLL